MKYSKKIILLVLFLAVGFTCAVFYAILQDKVVPDSLIEGWFKFTGVELLGLAGIKIFKIRKGE